MSNNTILYDNVENMVNLLTNVKEATIEQAYDLLNISGITHARWKDNDNTKKATIQALFKRYNDWFLPTLDNENDLKNKRITNMALRNPNAQKDIERFCGNYYIYYFSDHYKNEIHGGMIRIYKSEGSNYIKMINGIRDVKLLASKEFLNLFSSDTESFDEFIKFKESLPYLIDRRCYYYSGYVSVRETIFSLHLSGTEQRNEHSQIAIFDLQRVNTGMDKNTGNIRKYRGGLGFVISPSNKQHRNIRAYRMGISRWKINYDDPELKNLLKHTVTDYERNILTEEDDRRWYDLIVQYEKK